MAVRFTLERLLDAGVVPDLNQPTSIAVDAQGDLLLCDHPNGRPAVSRLHAQEEYRRETIIDFEGLGAPPVLVRTGPRGSLYVCCYPLEGAQPFVRRISGTGKREQPYPLPGTASDIAVGEDGKLWVIYGERSGGQTLQAYGTFGALDYDYEAAVEEARNQETVPPLFLDGQYLAVDPEGCVWFGAFLEQTSCVRLGPDGHWRYWDYPSAFEDARGFMDYTGLAAAGPMTLFTTDFRAGPGGRPEQWVVEIDLAARRLHWTSLADLGVAEMREPAEPSIWDIAWRDGLLYLCEYTHNRIIVLRGAERLNL